jgi:hypothetical protein
MSALPSTPVKSAWCSTMGAFADVSVSSAFEV